VLYGRAWGKLTRLIGRVTIQGANYITIKGLNYPTSDRGERSVSSYLVDHKTDESRTDSSSRKDEDVYREFFIEADYTDFAGNRQLVRWKCCGCAREGDILVFLELGPQNVLLRKCSSSDDMFEIVGWISETSFGAAEGEERGYLKIISDPELQYIARYKTEPYKPLGPRERFQIR
jgi:hypothetical protein